MIYPFIFCSSGWNPQLICSFLRVTLLTLWLFLPFSFIFLYSQERHPPFQDYSCNNRAPLVFVFCTLHLLFLIDFILFFISIKADCKTRGEEGFIFVGVAKLDPSISLSRKTNKMPILWGVHVAKLCNKKICKPSFSLWVAKWLFKAI